MTMVAGPAVTVFLLVAGFAVCLTAMYTLIVSAADRDWPLLPVGVMALLGGYYLLLLALAMAGGRMF
jgi:hypothetical protein